jgi:osmotically inducible protein OsmC
MPHIERTAESVWEGNLARGEGRINAVSSGAFSELPFSLPTRIGKPEGKTSPEELLAGAHAGCLAMALAGELTGAELPPERIVVRCTIVMDEVEGQGHQVTGSELTASVRAPGLAAETLARLALAAELGCPFTSLLRRAGASVSVAAQLLDSDD